MPLPDRRPERGPVLGSPDDAPHRLVEPAVLLPVQVRCGDGLTRIGGPSGRRAGGPERRGSGAAERQQFGRHLHAGRIDLRVHGRIRARVRGRGMIFHARAPQGGHHGQCADRVRAHGSGRSAEV